MKPILIKIINPHGKSSFLSSNKQQKSIKLLDVGCGNKSVIKIKNILPQAYYIGIDVGDYNQSSESFSLMDEYHITTSKDFVSKINEYSNIDLIISSHNLEHCEEPEKCLIAMANSLKKGGKIYLSFPSEESLYFPSRNGCLNFYDDKTHCTPPKFDNVIRVLNGNGVNTYFANKNYRPLILRTLGCIVEPISKKRGKVMFGTWQYWGFETVICGIKQ